MANDISGRRKKIIKAFIISLIILQGLYVIFPLPDIWPISNYALFSRSKVKTVASKLEMWGVKEDGKELLLNVPVHFYPLDVSRLSKGINRILYSEEYRKKNEKRVDLVVEYISFLPLNKVELKEKIINKLLYESKFENKEKAMDELFGDLLVQYEFNREKMSDVDKKFVKINELKLYRVKWDWTNTKPQNAVPESELIYSSETGLVQYE